MKNPRALNTDAAPNTHRAMRARMAKFSLGISAALVAAAAAAVGIKGLFSIQSPTGTPVGPSVRTPQHVATMLSRLESYVPSLHRNPDDDRHSLRLLLVPLDGRSKEQLIPVAKGWRSRDLNHVRLWGGDGKTVWFNVGGLGGVDVVSGKLIGPADLRRANPGLDEPWNDYRRIEFHQRLRVTSPDRQRVHEIEPESLRAEPVARGASRLPLTPDLQDFLSVGVHTGPNEWLALLSPRQAVREFRPKTLLSPVNAAEDAKEMRRFHRAELGPALDRGMRQVQSLAPLSPDEFLNAAFVRGAEPGEPIRIPGPESFLMAYTAAPGLGATLVVARVDNAGRVMWRADTGIDRFKLSQIMPGSPLVAFIGTRPPVPDKVSEPILVLVNTQSGAVSTTSLWQ